MRRIIELKPEDLAPTAAQVLASQGMAGRASIPEKIRNLVDSALSLFMQLAEPRGLLEEMPIADFPPVYDGSGMNAGEGPVPGIVPRADALALFAATLGSPLVTRSSELFKSGGPALGYMLDAVNTCAAEELGRRMCMKFLDLLPAGMDKRGLKAQYYCPGHCGWHISGQSKLFEKLKPEEIGMSINERWVMSPFKSISGILVAGDLEIHRFQPSFSFCSQCKEHKCVKRMLMLEGGS